MKRPDLARHAELERALLESMTSDAWIRGGYSSEIMAEMFSTPEHQALAGMILRQIAETGTLDMARIIADTAQFRSVRVSQFDDITSGRFCLERLYAVKDAYLHRGIYEAVTKADAEERDPREEGIGRLADLQNALEEYALRAGAVTEQDAYAWCRSFIESEREHGIPLGFSSIDKRAGGLPAKSYTVIGGDPGTGKTSIMLTSMLFNARRGVACDYWTYEMSTEDLLLRLASNVSGVQFARIVDHVLDAGERSDVARAIDEIQALPLRVLSKQRRADMLAMDIRSSRADVVYVDYLQNVPSVSNLNAYQQISSTSKILNAAAKDSGKRLVVAASLSRGDTDAPPTMHDFRDSGRIEYDADTAIILSGSEKLVQGIASKSGRQVQYFGTGPDDAYPECTVNIATFIVKSRHRRTGATILQFDKPRLRYFTADTCHTEPPMRYQQEEAF